MLAAGRERKRGDVDLFSATANGKIVKLGRGKKCEQDCNFKRQRTDLIHTLAVTQNLLSVWCFHNNSTRFAKTRMTHRGLTFENFAAAAVNLASFNTYYKNMGLE